MSASTPIWLLPNVLSLDAPVVAVVWQGFLAECVSLPLSPAARWVLGLTVWAIYLADRLLDVRDPAKPCSTARHRFYRRHQRAAFLLLGLVLAADAAVTLLFVRPRLIHEGLLPLAAVALYLALFHGGGWFRLPKEAAVAFLFTAGTFVAAWSRAGHPIAMLLWPATEFFLLCLANLVAIEMWETGERPKHRAIAWLGAGYFYWVPGLALLCAVPGHSAWGYAVALSAVLTTALYALRRRLSLELRRALVDAVMLTPLLFLR